MKIHDSALRRSGVWRRYLDIPNHPICPDYSNMYIRVDASDFPFIPRDELVVYMRKTLNFLYTDEIIWGGLGPNSGEMCLGFARLYLMGSKLDIPELMKEALKELSGMTVQLGPCEILHIAEFLYPNEEDVHSEFRIWFGKNGGCVVKSDDDAIKDRMKEAIFRGGYLARDLWTLKEKSQTEYRKDLGKDLAKVMASAQVLNNVLAKKD